MLTFGLSAQVSNHQATCPTVSVITLFQAVSVFQPPRSHRSKWNGYDLGTGNFRRADFNDLKLSIWDLLISEAFSGIANLDLGPGPIIGINLTGAFLQSAFCPSYLG